MDLLDKLRAIEARRAIFASDRARPGETVIERVLGPCEVTINGKPTLMFGSNNYLGLTLHPEVVAAARDAILEYGTGTTGSRTANGTLSVHEALEREFADWFEKRHALIFSTGYQANLSLIGALCGADDTILIDGDSHASIYDATRHTASQVVAFRHNEPESLRKKLERLPAGQRNRLVVVEGLYSIRGDVAPLREIIDVCRANGAYLLVDEAHSLGTFGPGGLGCAEAQGVLPEVDFIVGTFSKSLGGSAACASPITSSCARCIFSPGRTCSRRRDRPPTWRAFGPRSRHPQTSGAPRSTVGEHQTISRRPAGARLSHRPDGVADRADFHRRGASHDRALAGAARGRALRESDRAARLPARSVRAAGKLLRRAQRRADHACARGLRAGRRRAAGGYGLIQPSRRYQAAVSASPWRRSSSATIPSRSRRRST